MGRLEVSAPESKSAPGSLETLGWGICLPPIRTVHVYPDRARAVAAARASGAGHWIVVRVVADDGTGR